MKQVTDITGDTVNIASFSDFQEMMSEWLWETDANEVVIFFNGKLESRLGLDVGFFLGKKLSEILKKLPAWDSAQMQVKLDEFQRLIDLHVFVEAIEFQFVCSSAQETTLTLSVRPVKGGGSRGVGRFDKMPDSASTQVTHLKTLMTAVETSPNGVVITDSNGIIKYANPGFVTLCGYIEHARYDHLLLSVEFCIFDNGVLHDCSVQISPDKISINHIGLGHICIFQDSFPEIGCGQIGGPFFAHWLAVRPF